jgi:hypothetical protein
VGECGILICAAIFAASGATETRGQFDSCIEVSSRSAKRGLDTVGVVSLAWGESAFLAGAVSGKKAAGVLQVLPHYWCKGKTRKGCDLVDAGLRAYAYYVTPAKTFRDGICRYNSGRNCKARPRSIAFARSVELTKRNIEDALKGTRCLEARR